MRVQLLAALTFGALACQDKAGQNIVLEDQKAKVSYSIGLNFGKNLKQQDIDVDPAVCARGIQDALSGAAALMTEEEIRQCMTQFQQDMTAKQIENANKAGEKNMKEGETFLAENKSKVPLFRGASDEFIREIALQMRPVVFTPGDFVYKAGEHGNDMYFITRGALEVVAHGAVQTTLSEGDFFGEIALVLSQPRTASVRAISFCDLYRLDREMFNRVLSHYPDIAAQIEATARARQERG